MGGIPGATLMSTTIDDPAAAGPKLPLWNTICMSYSTYFGYFPDVLRISWLWLMVIVPLTAVMSWVQFSWFAEFVANVQRGTPPQMPIRPPAMPTAMFVLMYPVGLLAALAAVSIAVAWHRRIILGEQPRLSGSNILTKYVWRYVLIGIAICLTAWLPVFAIMTAILFLVSHLTSGSAQHPMPFVVIIPIFLVFLAAAAVLLRLSLLLPARAVGDFGVTFKETWRRGRGNTWQIFWGIAACSLPPLFAAEIALLLFALPPVFSSGLFPTAQMVAVTALLNGYYLLIMPIGIGFLSLSYRHFFRQAQSS